MNATDHNDTIAALATAPLPAALAVIRISGPKAGEILARVFTPARPGALVPRVLRLGMVNGPGGRPVDQAMAVFMPGPASHTGEDVAEIHCHGGCVTTAMVLEMVLAAGARPAGPGEFTKRAFLSGKIDLTQAEAVADLISAPGRVAAALALDMHSGRLGATVRELRERLMHLSLSICLAVDFPEEEECLDLGPDFARELAAVIRVIDSLLEGCRRAAPIRQGAVVVLAGPVNAGKSSLLNALIGRERAIVSPVPGTTRDFLEESVDLSGLTARLCDTAGLRHEADPTDLVEGLGLTKGRELASRADLVVLVTDGSAPLAPEAREALAAEARQWGARRVLAVVNKADLPWPTLGPLAAMEEMGLQTVSVSARTGQGLEDLSRAMRRRILEAHGGEPSPDAVAVNPRQAAALAQAKDELAALAEDLVAAIPPDCLGVRLDAALAHLAGITGEIATEEVLSSIFERFCIGK